jgi:hypothetical protein
LVAHRERLFLEKQYTVAYGGLRVATKKAKLRCAGAELCFGDAFVYETEPLEKVTCGFNPLFAIILSIARRCSLEY